MAKTIRVIKYDPITQTATEEEISDWTQYAPMIGCRTFEIAGDNPKWDIYCDEEGAFIEGNLVTAIEGNYNKLAGVLVFTGKADNEGATLGLDWKVSCEDIQKATNTAWRIG